MGQEIKIPFVGSRQLKVGLEEICPLVDRTFLYQRLWQFPKPKDILEQKRLETIFNDQMSFARKNSIITPMASYGYFPSRRIGNGTFVEFGRKGIRFDFPRDPKPPHFCLADIFEEYIALALATVGQGVSDAISQMYTKGEYSRMFYLKGLAAVCVEATLEYVHRLMRSELGFRQNVGKRYSLGYPMCPNLSDQPKILILLNANSLGVTTTTTYQLVPEHSVTAFISLKEGV